MRPFLVSALNAKLLGPSNGPTEVLDERPDLIYSVGILVPKEKDDVLSGLEDLNHSVEGGISSDEIEGDENIEAPPAPWLDGRVKPSSFGISFSCSSTATTPRFEICITYGRYVLDGETGGYKRVPRACYIPSETIESSLEHRGRRKSSTLYFETREREGHIHLVPSSEREAEIGITSHVRRNNADPKSWTVTVLLHSEISFVSDGNKTDRSSFNIHQPEIRVNVLPGTLLTEPAQATKGSPEDKIDAELYKGRGQLARGHMASAIWKEFDPQAISEQERSSLTYEHTDGSITEIGHLPPFNWIDANHPALKEVKDNFLPPDTRTEFLPMVNLPAPDMNPEWENEAIYDASKLACAETADDIAGYLEPLVEGYEAWIASSYEQDNEVHQELRRDAIDALSRMRRGIEFLKQDEKARMAFNIANEALALNVYWQTKNNDGGPVPLMWRKFQLAFALSSLESSVKAESPDREKLDLLWVATGGGKTEAYLLISAFVLVYNRLAYTAPDGTPLWQGVGILTRYTLRLLTIQQFRRSLGMVTALEFIRVRRKNTGHIHQLGDQPFSIGMWVGGNVTPNKFSVNTVKTADGIRNLREKSRQTAKKPNLDLREYNAVESLAGGNGLPRTAAKKLVSLPS